MFFFDCLRRNGVSRPAENRLQFLMNAAAKRTLRGIFQYYSDFRYCPCGPSGTRCLI